jgi:hypothetical protein
MPRFCPYLPTCGALLGININGIEEIDGVLYVQSWWCRKE